MTQSIISAEPQDNDPRREIRRRLFMAEILHIGFDHLTSVERRRLLVSLVEMSSSRSSIRVKVSAQNLPIWYQRDDPPKYEQPVGSRRSVHVSVPFFSATINVPYA